MKITRPVRRLYLVLLLLLLALPEAAFAEEGGERGAGLSADEWLPIGSVVLLRNGSKSLMIAGRVVQNASDGLVYDYCACAYPEGYVSSQMYFFNQTDIAIVASKGYENEYELLYRKEILDGVDSANLVVVDGRMVPRETAEALSADGETESEEDISELESEAGPETGDETEIDLEIEVETEVETETEAESGTGFMLPPLETPDKLETESDKAREAKKYKVAQNLNLRENPSTDANILVTITGGSEVTEDLSREIQKEWIPVIYKSVDGSVMNGWVNSEFLQED